MTSQNLIMLSTRLMALALLATLVACSVIPESEPVKLLDPTLPTPARAGKSVAWTLNINRPQSDPARDSNRVMVRTADGQLQVLPQMRWIATAPDLFRTLLVRYLRDSHTVAQVSNGASGMARTLQLDIRQFELVENADNLLQASISVEARLYHSRSARLLTRHIFKQQQDIAGTGAAEIISGFEISLRQVIEDIASWLAEYDIAASSANT
ncbi:MULTISPECIES: ABC-type transport auxiliary lipoprotein family protein [unclassified Arsukibacterium]|uniref:ABC-type transport auxiliary lipoprotein family protein n=1 Tax=unclassified Arsukibacterium TaxID=2635278 RepID=UPI000C47BAF3|nr:MULTISPECIES: ABC-type transport auxiliary lipoprotein family protein [unclassified Arsukibacterium]MBM35171.1 hypothetical protein [Rheinheimera sp.]HAW94112.1 hypothetical protein [Candidatus Azambacteria bacterium]